MLSKHLISALLIASATATLSIPLILGGAQSRVISMSQPPSWSSAMDRYSTNNMDAVRALKDCPGCSSAELAACTACLGAEARNEGSLWPSGNIVNKSTTSRLSQSSLVVIVPSTATPPRRSPGEPWISLSAAATRSNSNSSNGGSNSSNSSRRIESESGRDGGQEALIKQIEEAGQRIEESHGHRFDMSIKVVVDYHGSLGDSVAAMFFEQDSTLVICPSAYGAAAGRSPAAAPSADLGQSAGAGLSPAIEAWLASSRGLGKFPVKCYMCIVLMATAVPLAVNMLLQDIAMDYCKSRGMTPEECDPIRFSEPPLTRTG